MLLVVCNMFGSLFDLHCGNPVIVMLGNAEFNRIKQGPSVSKDSPEIIGAKVRSPGDGTCSNNFPTIMSHSNVTVSQYRKSRPIK